MWAAAVGMLLAALGLWIKDLSDRLWRLEKTVKCGVRNWNDVPMSEREEKP